MGRGAPQGKKLEHPVPEGFRQLAEEAGQSPRQSGSGKSYFRASRASRMRHTPHTSVDVG